MKIKKVKSLFGLFEIVPEIKKIEKHYPSVLHWYINKVIPNVGRGKRIVLIGLNEEKQIVGFIIGKKVKKEKKICCLMIFEEFRNKGFAIKLIERMCEELKESHPVCSVSEDMLPMYETIFIKKFGWTLKEVKQDLYVKGKKEFFFNQENSAETKI